MNGNFYQNPTFPTATNPNDLTDNYIEVVNESENISRAPIVEQKNIVNILKLNIGKSITAFCTFSDSKERRDKDFDGIIEDISDDYLLLSNPNNGEWYLILLNNLNYIVFHDKIVF